MKVRSIFLATLFTMGTLATMLGIGSVAGAQQRVVLAPRPPRPVKITLQCRNYGGSQDVSKNPDIINNTKQTIPAGRMVYWQSSDGDGGSFQLNQTFVPGAKIGVNGKPGQSYTCTAYTVL